MDVCLVRGIQWWRGIAWALPGMAVALGCAAAPVQVREMQRTVGDKMATVALPDTITAATPAAEPVRATYRAEVALVQSPRRLALYSSGLIAHARLRFNGHVIADSLDDPVRPLPRSYDRIRLIDVPEEFVRAGTNTIEIEAAGRNFLSLAPLQVGERSELAPLHTSRVLKIVVGPAIAAVVVGSLALSVLLLWARRGDALYGYFGIGTLGWAVHDAWSILPVSPLHGVHLQVWWHALFTFFVAMLVIFCVRFAGWRWPRVEGGLVLAALAGPAVLYAANAAGALGPAAEIWLLAWIGIVALGLVAVGRYAWAHRNGGGLLLLLTGAVSLVFAVHDWNVSHRGLDNYPVYLVPYAGLMFVVLVAWMLIDRFVAASREIEAMNTDLERRVTAKGAALVQALEEMQRAKESAEAANKSKSSFLAAASHDLRQPVHALGLYMTVLGEEALPARQRDLVQRMRGSLAALESMFSALIDVSRMDAGAVVPRPVPFALGPVLHRLAEEIAPQATAKGLRLSVRIAPAARWAYARSDPMLVERIVRNLLSNAVKYTATGGVLLACRLRGGAAEGGWHVEVWDTGQGIDAADQERVFEEFLQLGNPERDRAQGLGLGLSIVRRLVDLLGARVRLQSRPGRGTRFVLELPSAAPVVGEAVAAPPVVSVSGLAVALIDDDAEVRHSMELLLRHWGCRVETGADEDDLVGRLDATRWVPDAVIADYRLREGRTGIDAIGTLRARHGPGLPALLVSGDSSPDRVVRMEHSGLPWISKPVSPQVLRQWLGQVAFKRHAALEPALGSGS